MPLHALQLWLLECIPAYKVLQSCKVYTCLSRACVCLLFGEDLIECVVQTGCEVGGQNTKKPNCDIRGQKSKLMKHQSTVLIGVFISSRDAK